MSSISWVETNPSDDTAASLMDDAIRSMLSAIGSGISTFAYLEDGSAASDGEMRLGMWRAADVNSLASCNALNGYIGDVQTSIAHIGSQQTGLFTHAWMEEHNTAPSAPPYTARWVVAEGSYNTTWSSAAEAAGAITVTTGLTYNGIPHIEISVVDDDFDGAMSACYGVDNVTTTTFDSHISLFNADSVGALDVHWRSLGTISY